MLPPDVDALAAIAASGVCPVPGDFSVVETSGGRVLFTAPHAVCHYAAGTPGKVKGADVGTGDLAIKLAAESGSRALVAQAPWPGNANADSVSVCVFKQRVLRLLDDGLVTTVIDLHGMSERHGLDVCVGSGGMGAGLATAIAARPHPARAHCHRPRRSFQTVCQPRAFRVPIAIKPQLGWCPRFPQIRWLR